MKVKMITQMAGPDGCRQPGEIVDDQLRPVIILLPVVVLAARAAVALGGGEVKELSVEDDRAVRAETGEKLVYSLDQNLSADGNLRRLSESGRLRCNALWRDITQNHFSEHRSFKSIAVCISGKNAVPCVPAMHIVALKAAAIHSCTVLLESKHIGAERVAQHLIGKEENVFRVAAV